MSMRRIVRNFPLYGLVAVGSLNTAAYAVDPVVIPAPPVPVTVTNTPTVNVKGTVPVSGSVNANITGVNGTVPVTGTVNANIIGGSVTATLPPSLTIDNSPYMPVMSSNTGDPGRLPYQANNQFPPCTVDDSGLTCAVRFAAIPAGKRLVLQNVNWAGAGNPAPTMVYLSLSGGWIPGTGAPFQYFDRLVPVAPYPYLGSQLIQLDTNLLFYAEAGDLYVTLTFPGVTTLDFVGPVNLVGYLVDCTLGACAPIVAQ